MPGESKVYFLPGTFHEDIKRAWESAEVNDTFLPGTFSFKILKVPGKVRKQRTLFVRHFLHFFLVTSG